MNPISSSDTFECLRCNTLVSNHAQICPTCGLEFYPPDEPVPTPPATHPCAKCGGAFVKGFVLDTGPRNRLEQAVWVEGEPRAKFFNAGLTVDDQNIYLITSFRCQTCGWLELYATIPVT